MKKYEIFIEDKNGNRLWGNGQLNSYGEVHTLRGILHKVGLHVYDAEKEVNNPATT